MKKTIFLLNINGYSKEITELTYPLIRYYADKIGAEIYEIKERRYPQWPITYEKIQIYDLGREMKNDWNIYIDSDTVIHPETIDWTLYLNKDTVAHNGSDFANVRWRYDKYFMRDGRNVGSCNWMTIASDWCLDLWHPLDISLEEVLSNIRPTIGEVNTIITKEHLIDDYTLSRNIARYGLKFKRLQKLQEEIGLPDAYFFWHEYVRTIEEKINGWEEDLWNNEKGITEKKHISGIKDILDQWNIPKHIREYDNSSNT